MSLERFDELFEQLDLTDHIASLQAFLSREKPLPMEGDQERHFKHIEALDKLEFKAPPKVSDFAVIRAHLSKSGVLRFEQIFELLKVVRYFRYLKNREFSGLIGSWMEKIEIPEGFADVDPFFDEAGSFNEERDEELLKLGARIKALRGDIASQLKRIMHTQKISSYLVDTQVHYLNDEECLLVRGGFNHVLKGNVIGRSTAGFFYVSPDAIVKTKEQIKAIETEREARFYEYAKGFSAVLKELLPFIKFIDKEFDRFDHYQSRVLFARSKNYAIIRADAKDDAIVLEGFEHPALHKPKPVTVDFSKAVLMITGVNAGGKTMLLKSILSAAVMAKYLVPMKINEHKSKIGGFKQIQAVIDDPQNVGNDISTFAGRMLQFSKLFGHRSALIGVDEIELGTDSDEAAALFKVMLDELISKGQKIVVTTHHKRLAALMADRDDVELMAAVYDEERRMPTYEFLQGIIGKSYAFETALRYGIQAGIVDRAKEVYGEQHEKLNLLIERGSELERELKRKNALLDEKLEAVEKKELELKEAKERVVVELKMHKQQLRREYDMAIKEAKEAAKGKDTAAIHRQMNKAQQKLPKEQEAPVLKEATSYTFEVGQAVKYRTQRGTIVSMKAKEAVIEVEGMRVRVKLGELKPAGQQPNKPPKTDVKVNRETKSGLKLDLHGKRAAEAEEMLDKFISDALLQGWDEVIVYHGIGTGKLAYAVKEFLKKHPKVKKFEDAPLNMGGYGAKLVTL
jgi:DNA mismatch repair protein MutS2